MELDRDIEEFLAKNDMDISRGPALLIRIVKYLSRKLGLANSSLAKKIYAWRPLVIIVDIFRPGSYVFVSRSLFIYYNKIR